MTIQISAPQMFREIISDIVSAGGSPYIVGGAVLDALRGLHLHHFDIECFGVSYAQLESVLQKYGRANLVGKNFGVIKLQSGKYDFDFSIPRKDSKAGIGHRGFDIELIPDLPITEAARRRDITINAVYLHAYTGEIVDPFGGVEDFTSGRIRAVDPVTFVEDPLRVLRIMQLLPRKAKFVDDATLRLCAGMVDSFDTLPRERIFEEFRKLLMLTDMPSPGLQFLKDCGWISKFPELEAIIGVPQHPVHHPEGDVWTHTLLVIDHAAKLREHLPTDWQLAYMFGMLCHDLGKAKTTDSVTYTAYNHENVGADMTLRLLRRMTGGIELPKKVLQIVKMHMRPYALFTSNSGDNAWKRLHNELPLHIAAYVTQADSNGRRQQFDSELSAEARFALDKSIQFGEEKIRPVLQGKHLIAHGLEPGPEFTAILNRAYDFQLDTGCEDIETLFMVGTRNFTGD